MFSSNFVSRGKEYATFVKFVPAPYFRKTFYLERIKGNEKIIISGLGFYRFWVNGKEITKGLLSPYISNPDDIIYYDEYDVSSYLVKGKNVFAFMLGNGFLNNPGGKVWHFDKARFRSAPKLAFSFEIDNKTIFEADESIKSATSPLLFDDYRAGEYYDARKEIKNWNQVDFDDSSWDNAIKVDAPLGEARLVKANPIAKLEEIKPIEIRKVGLGYLYVFPINLCGIFRLKINTKKGKRISIDFGERLLEGDLDMTNISFGAKTPKDFIQHLEYIASGEENETYEPSFSYYGFGYAKVNGIEDNEATLDLLTMIRIRSNYKKVGSFSCSNKTINRLEEMAINSMDSNIVYFPTDCPHREKNGWTGDIALSTDYLCYHANLSLDLKEWLNNVRKAQTKEGVLPGIIPTTGWGFAWGNGPAWDEALTNAVFFSYQYEGDESIVLENEEAMIRYLKYSKTRLDKDGLASYGLGDWCETKRISGDYQTDLRITDTLSLIEICSNESKLFNRLNRKKSKQFVDEYRDQLVTSFRKFFIKDKRFKKEYMTQTALAMAMEIGVVNEDEIDNFYEDLINLIHQNNDHFQVGVLGARRLFRVLAKKDINLALKLMIQDSYPSFGYWEKMGLTALPEEFQMEFEMKKDGSIEPKNPNDRPDISSLNHHFWGDFTMVFIRYIAGLNINDNLDDSVFIDPIFPEEVSFAKAEREFKGEKVGVKWFKENGKYVVEYLKTRKIKVNVVEKCNVIYKEVESLE
ncbi:MAG TPA: hypothetical protein DD377_01065 [Firmicutes bacterium]|nr:hypothetical protein [Bacillota bacterium]